MPQTRQLAAIMFTDIVGYTALMGKDEQNAFRLLDQNRELQKPIIEEFNGRWIKELGDGVMASFNTVSDAVNSAVKIQEACNAAKDFQLRIGIHLGEVVFENDDVFGDGVNIAARIQAAAQPGCIFISESVHQNVSNKNDFKSQFVKEEKLKNVHQPVRMYQVLFAGSEIIEAEKSLEPVVENSIAVLPFVNMSNDLEQEYFSDGISEEIINMLAQVPDLKVIGRTSSFAFKGKNMDLKVIGKQLCVKHLLEGSVRKAGSTLRITSQLIEVSNGFHLYSEKFDRKLEDIFAIQDEISLAILDAVKIKLLGDHKKALVKKDTDNVEAYELYLKGRYHINKFTPEGFLKAIEYLKAAIVLEPTYAIAYAELTFCYTNLKDFNWLPREESLPQAFEAGYRSLELDDTISESHMAVGRLLLHQDWNIKKALVEYKKALAINPNSADAHIQIGFCLSLMENYQEAMSHAKIAESLDPFSILNIWYLAVIPYCAGDYEQVLAYGMRIIELEASMFSGYLWVGAAYLGLKKYDRGIKAYEKMVQLNAGPYTLSLLGLAYGLSGKKQQAKEIIRKMKEYDVVEDSGNTFLANVYASLGEFDTAYQYYDRAIENREGQVIWTRYYIIRYLPEIMEDPRTYAMFEKMNIIY
jgi:TolB-like protein/class 3 adenylate cyclase